MYFDLHPATGSQLLKRLEFLVIRSTEVVFCYVNEGGFGTPQKDRDWLPGGPTTFLEGWNFQPHPPASGGGVRGWTVFKVPGRMNNPQMRAHDSQTSLHDDSTARPLEVLLGRDHKSKREGALAVIGVNDHFLCPPPHPTHSA